MSLMRYLLSGYGPESEMFIDNYVDQFCFINADIKLARFVSLDRNYSFYKHLHICDIIEPTTFKPILTQTKNSTTTIVKEHKDIKSQMDALRSELEETKELVIALQNLTMDNSQKLLAISMSSDQLLEGFDQPVDMDAEMEACEIVDEELVEPADSSAIDLKELVKQEFNLEA